MTNSQSSDPSLCKNRLTCQFITSKIKHTTKRLANQLSSQKNKFAAKSYKALESQLGLIIIVTFSVIMNFSIASAKNAESANPGNLTGLTPEAIADTAAAINKYTPLITNDKTKIQYAMATQSDDNYINTSDNFSTNLTPADQPAPQTTPQAAPAQRAKTINYTVQSGDTLSSIASSFNLSISTIQYSNDLTNADQLKLGQVLKIPVNNLSSQALAKAQNKQTSKKQTLAYASRNTTARDSAGSTRYIVPLTSYSMISQSFGSNGHTGIDYATPIGTTVRASASGTVVEAESFGWNYGWGKTVLISHGNGVTTRYGHLSQVNVSVGDHVSQGEVIGKSGTTGHSTGPHLHFEKDVNGHPVYPY